jgi:hypothetical protein
MNRILIGKILIWSIGFLAMIVVCLLVATVIEDSHSHYGIHKIELTVTSINNTTHMIVAENEDGWELTFLSNEFNREMHVGDKFTIEVDTIPKQWGG